MSSARRKSAGRLYLISVSPRKGVLAIAKERFFLEERCTMLWFFRRFSESKEAGMEIKLAVLKK